MSTEVSEAAVDELNHAFDRNVAIFTSQQWVDSASAVLKAGREQAAAQLAPGETVEWLASGIVHRHGKVWPGALLLVTPHRFIVSASRGSIRTKREVSSLYRGPESLMSVSHRLLPGSSADHWMLEIATQEGPFLFAVPTFTGSESLAQITGAFVAGRARYAPETGILFDGAPWGAPAQSPTTQVISNEASESSEGSDPFAAAKADLGALPGTDSPAGFDWPEESVEQEVQPSVSSEPPVQAFWTPELEQESEVAAADYPAMGSYDVFESVASAEPTGPQATSEPATPQAIDSGPTAQAQENEASVSEPAAVATPEPHQVAPAELPPADWYPDPLGEAELRYWDGQAWTHHTAR